MSAHQQEIRARDLVVGDLYEEPGMDPVRIAHLGEHGDTVLITGAGGEKITLDGDVAVMLLDRAPIEGTVRVAVAVELALVPRPSVDVLDEAERLVLDGIDSRMVVRSEAHPDPAAIFGDD